MLAVVAVVLWIRSEAERHKAERLSAPPKMQRAEPGRIIVPTRVITGMELDEWGRGPGPGRPDLATVS
jgi:hypothetical protein